jgi:hypothetical protein
MEKVVYLATSLPAIAIVFGFFEIIYYFLIKFNKISSDKSLGSIFTRIFLVVFFYELILFLSWLFLKIKDYILDNFLGINTISKNLSEFILSPIGFVIFILSVESYKYYQFHGKLKKYLKTAVTRFYFLLLGYVFLSFITSYILMYLNNTYYIYLSTSKKLTETFSKPITIFIVIFILLTLIYLNLISNKKQNTDLIKTVRILIGIMIFLFVFLIEGNYINSVIIILFFLWLYSISNKNE